jgi:hypothetical protein
MSRIIIHAVNAAIFILIVMGIPAITSMQLGSIQLTSTPHSRMLTLWGLGFAAGGNAILAFMCSNRRSRWAGLTWVLVFGGFLLAQYLFFAGLLQFDWLKKLLLKLKSKS